MEGPRDAGADGEKSGESDRFSGSGGYWAIGDLADRWTARQSGSCRHEALEFRITLEHPVHARRKTRHRRIGQGKPDNRLAETGRDESRMDLFENCRKRFF